MGSPNTVYNSAMEVLFLILATASFGQARADGHNGRAAGEGHPGGQSHQYLRELPDAAPPRGAWAAARESARMPGLGPMDLRHWEYELASHGSGQGLLAFLATISQIVI